MAYNVDHLLRVGDAKTLYDSLKGEIAIIPDIESAINYIPQTPLTNKTIDTNTSAPILPANIATYSGWCCLCVPCVPGDVFYVTGKGGNTTRLWAFASSDGTRIQQSASGVTETAKKLVAPANAAYFAFNSNMSNTYAVYKGVKPVNAFTAVNGDMANVSNAVAAVNDSATIAVTTEYTGKKLGTSGWAADDTLYDVSGAVFIDGVDLISVDYDFYDNGSGVGVAFYSSASIGTSIVGYAAQTISGKLIAVPSGAKYVRLTYATGTTHNIRKVSKRMITAQNPFVITAKQASLTDGQTLTACSNIDNKKNDIIVFHAEVDAASFGSVSVGHGYDTSYGAYLILDDTNITVYYGTSQYVVKAHGLTIDKFIHIEIAHTNNARAKIRLYSSDGSYEIDSSQVAWGGCRGDVFATSTDSTLTNCVLSVAFRDWATDIFICGDSYVGLGDNTRWPYYALENGFDKFAVNGYGGVSSASEFSTFQNIIAKARPKFFVWTLGMNDSDGDGAINASYKTYLDAFINTCVSYGVTPILATIPNTPERLHTYKNAYVKSLGYRYIDFAAAVGAEDAESEWYTGMLDEDDVHPTALGAKALYTQVVTDFPEITKA